MLCSKIEIEDSEGTVIKMEDEGYSEPRFPEPCAITFPKIKEEVKWDPDELAELALLMPGVGDSFAKMGGPHVPEPDGIDVVDLTREECDSGAVQPDVSHKPELSSAARAQNEAPPACLSPSKNFKRKSRKGVVESEDCVVVESTSSSTQTAPETTRGDLHTKRRASASVDSMGQQTNSSECQVCLRESEKESGSPHADKGQYFCSLCGALFLWKHYLDKHMASHAEEMPHSCPVCPAKFRLRESLAKHMRFHPGSLGGAASAAHPLGALLGCGVCDLRFVLREQLRNHLLAHPDRKLFFCAGCKARFPLEDELLAHVVVHSEGKREPVSCPSCTKDFPSKKLLEIHAMVSHQGRERCSQPPGSSPARVTTPSSARSRKSVADQRRRTLESGGEPPVGDVHATLGENFFPQHRKKKRDVSDAVVHKEKPAPVHKVENTRDSCPRNEVRLPREKLHCRLCSAEFRLKHSLDNHVSVYHPEKRL